MEKGKEGEATEHVPAFLLPDAAWKNIQQNTFTRWVNNHLQKAGEHVDNLETDLSDGLRLIKLVEVLAHKLVGKYNRKVSFRSQKLENVSVALKFLQVDEHIKIVNIDSSHIVDANRKLILGLIWTLIVHYSISMNTWEAEEGERAPVDQTPKQRLLAWIRSKLPSDVPVTNFTSDWNDGVALGALVDALAPGYLGDWRNWNPDDAVGNTKRAMDLANEELAVAPLITPEELINPNIDEKSVMTFLAQFPQAKIAIPKGTIRNIDNRPIVGHAYEFVVTTPSEQYKPKISIRSSDGSNVHFTVTKPTGTTYAVKYTPERTGHHEITLHVVDVSSGDGRAQADAAVSVDARSAARLQYETDTRLGSGPVHLRLVDADGASVEDIDIVVVTPEPHNEEQRVVVTAGPSDTFLAEYTPTYKGLHSVNVFQERRPLPGNPFPLRVKGKVASELRAWGRGLAALGIVAGDTVQVNVDVEEDEKGMPRADVDLDDVPIHCIVVDAEGTSHSARLLPHSDSRRRVFEYSPPSAGNYQVEVTAEGEEVGASPYKVSVGPSCSSLVRAFGPGLEGGVATHPSVFYVESNGDTKTLEFAVEGPSKTEIRCGDRGNGSAIVEYTPSRPGVYSVSILSGKEHILNSPFVILVDPHDNNLRPSNVRVTGLDGRDYSLQRPIEFNIDTSHASDSLLIPSVSVLDSQLQPVATTITQLVSSETSSPSAGHFACSFQPTHTGQHFVNVSVKGVSVPGAPFPVNVVDASRLRIFGPGVEGPVTSQQPTHFTIDAKQAGRGTLEVALNDREGRSVDIDVLDNDDGSFTVKYTAPRPGPYQLNVVFAGAEIPKIEINVKPHVDLSGIRVEGLENAIVTVNVEKEVHVFTSNHEKTRIVIRSPSGRILEAVIEPSENGLRVRFTPSEIGDYTIDVTCEDIDAPSSSSLSPPSASFPFHALPQFPSPVNGSGARSHEAEYVVTSTGPPRAEMVRVFGPGLGPVMATKSAKVFIDTSEAGLGDIDLFVDGPTRTPIHCVDNHNSTCVMNYVPRLPGIYWLRVLFDGIHVPGNSAFIGQPIPIRVDPRGQKASLQGVEVLVHEDASPGKWLRVKGEEDGDLHSATYIPTRRGHATFKVLFDGVPVVEKSISIVEGCDPSKVVVSGEGLASAIVGDTAHFSIDTRKAGSGKIMIDISGPSEVKTEIVDHGDGTASVGYVPTRPGLYTVSVFYGEERAHASGSPFKSLVDYPKSIGNVRVLGLENFAARSGELRRFTIDATETAERPVEAQLPAGQQPPVIIPRESDPRLFDVHFTPSGDGGETLPLEVLYDGEHVNGSPFPLSLRPASDPSAIRLVSPAVVPASRDGVILIDRTEEGRPADLEIEITGPDGRRRRYELTPTSTEGVDELRFRTDLPGEYFIVLRQRGADKTKASSVVKQARLTAQAMGRKEDVAIGSSPSSSSWIVSEEKRWVLTRAVDDPNARLTLLETSGLGVEYSVETRQRADGRWEDAISIRPRKTGKHRIVLLYGGVQVEDGVIEFEVLSEEEAAAARANDAAAKADRDAIVAENEKRYYDASEHLETRPEYEIGLGAAPVRLGTPVENNNNQTDSQLVVNGLSRGGVYDERVFPFDFDPNEINAHQLQAIVEMPGAAKDAAEIIDNHDGTVLVKYTPKTSGNHVLSILHQGTIVQGTPISFYVDQYSDGYATIYGPGTQGGVVGEPAHFTVCAKHGHAKELSVSIEGPAQANIKIHDNKDGTCSVSWIPPMPGEYKVHVKLASRELSQSPFKVLVAGEGSKRAHLSVGSTSEVALNITETELKGISASIKSPSGIEEPCFVRIIEGGRLGVSFTPREAGEHLITVKRNGKLVPKAPFKIKVDKSQVGDASKVEVTGDGRSKAVTQQWNEILVDTTKAGYGGLSVSVQGPSKAELQCKEKRAGLVQVLYKPSEPGVYAIAIKFADHHVKSSPITVHCTGPSGGAVKEEITKRTDQAPISLVDQEANLFLKLPNTSPMDTVARVMDPKGNTEDVELRDQGACFYLVKFRPKVEGAHALSVLHKDAHINGSPFQFTVGTFSEGGSHKVRASGMGVVRGETNNFQSFNVYSREAGPGNLSVAIEGPSRATMKFEDHKDGNCHVDYKVATPGEYVISVKFNDAQIPDSPFKVFIAPATGEVRKLELASWHDTGIPVGKAFTFTVLTHRARGHLEAKVLAPNGESETIDIVPIEEGESYALRLVPKESGNHYIHVTLDGAPMRESPFRLRVGGKDECDPTAIQASGEGLVSGQTGQKCEFVVKTANAGAGILTCQIDGPSKVTLDAYELEHGYKGRYTPLAPGDYYAAIKYNGIHIPGSPYKIRVDGKTLGGNGYNETSVVKIDAVAKTSKGTVAVAPIYKGDSSKVTAKGAGLNKFFPGRPAMFTIDTGLAGPNILMVAVVTTKGPCEEVVVKHQGAGHYIVTYRVMDRVKGFVFIKYGDQEIPGSPFALEP